MRKLIFVFVAFLLGCKSTENQQAGEKFEVFRGTNLPTGFPKATSGVLSGNNLSQKRILRLLLKWDLTMSDYLLMKSRCGMKMGIGIMMRFN